MLLFRPGEGTYREKGLKRNSSGNARPQSSQLTEPLWADKPGLMSGAGVHELLSTYPKKKKAQAGSNSPPNFPSNPRMKGGKRSRYHVIAQLTITMLSSAFQLSLLIFAILR